MFFFFCCCFFLLFLPHHHQRHRVPVINNELIPSSVKFLPFLSSPFDFITLPAVFSFESLQSYRLLTVCISSLFGIVHWKVIYKSASILEMVLSRIHFFFFSFSVQFAFFETANFVFITLRVICFAGISNSKNDKLGKAIRTSRDETIYDTKGNRRICFQLLGFLVIFLWA